MGKTKIPYAEHNWETVGGCEKIKSGCKNCYAVNLIHRFSSNPIHQDRYDGLVKDGKWTGKIKLFDDRMEQPLRRHIPTTYFVYSRSDTLHKDVPATFINKMWSVMDNCPQHTFLVFTKRFKRARSLAWWPKNVRLYFSASTQKEVDEAVPILLQIPVAVRGLSLEPLISNIDLRKHLTTQYVGVESGHEYTKQSHAATAANAKERSRPFSSVIIGCESGPNRRPCKLQWVEDIVRHCEMAEIAPTVKQIPIDGQCVPLNDDNRAIWPAWARREMPKGCI